MVDMNQTDVKAMQTLIRLASAGARKKDISELSVDWSTVLPLAAEQQVIPLVACALLHSPGLVCPDQLHEYLLNVMRAESSANMIRRQRIMYLLQEMKAAGIDAKLLKGYAVSGCYAHPECRGSVDTDILIDVKQETQVIKFMEDHEFRVDPRAATSHHTVCQHKKYGMVELHVALYADLVQDNWFQNVNEEDLVQEPARLVEGFHTLGHTDQLIFLSLHMVKHFILDGLTLKMMLDIGLYFVRHKQEIDAVRYWAVLKKLHYDGLVSVILWNMICSGGFLVDDFPGLPEKQPEQMTLVMHDLLHGGYMGVKQKNERLESGMEYNRQLLRKQQSAIQYRLHMIDWKIKSGAKYMFPTGKMLQKLYPITRKNPVLIPLLWIWQFVSFPIKKIRSGALKRDVRSENSATTKVTEDRITMFKELGML